LQLTPSDRRVRLTSAFALALCSWFASVAPAGATTFTVLNTADSGADSLRAALTSAQNCTGSPHTMAFNVPGGSLTGGVAVIAPLTVLPPITCGGTTIDGTTQTAKGGNTNNVTLGTGGTVGTGPDGRPGTGDEPALPQLNGPEVEIVGSNLTTSILTVAASDLTIRGLSLHGGGSFAGNGTGSGTIWIQSGTGILIEQNVIGSSATSYTLPVGSQTQDNVVLITGGGDITIEENLMGFARWRTILFLSPTIGAATVRDNEIEGSFDGIDFGNVGIGPSGAVTLTRNYIHDSVDNASGSTDFALVVSQTGSGSTSITANTVRNVDVPASIDSTRPVLIQHNILTGGVFDAVDHFSGSEAVTIDRNATFSAVVQVFKADNDPANQRGAIVTGDGKNAAHGEGAIFLGTVTAVGMGLLDTTIGVPVGVTLLAGDPITCTASDLLPGGNTSEFGPNAYLPIVLDIDANGVTDPLTDGLLVLRFLFGFTGTTLTNGAVGNGCMRCSAGEIVSHTF
jgi:hypothetical protein